MDRQLQGYIKRLINSTIVIIAAEGIIRVMTVTYLRLMVVTLNVQSMGKTFFASLGLCAMKGHH